jgi:uncharacterized membrane protein (DUF485 family)
MLKTGRYGAGMFLQLAVDWQSLLQRAIPYVTQGLVALAIVLISWGIGVLLGRAVNRLIERSGLERAFDSTDVGRAFRAAGVDLSNLIGMLVTAFVIVIGIVVALGYLRIGGEAGAIIARVAEYLPRLIGGVILLTAGLIPIALLTNYIGRLLTGMFPKQFTELGEMFRNLLLVGLVALVVSIALDMMLFTGQFVYPLILGAVIMCAGVFIGYTLVRNIVEDHPEFASAAPYAKFMLYLVFVTVGLGAIFANFPETAHVIQNVAWGIAIAVGVMAAPIVYALYRRAVAERERGCSPEQKQ